MNKIDIDTVMSWGPCYSRDRMLRLSGGKTELTPLQICDLQDVSTGDKLWLLLRPEIIPDVQLHILACHWAEQALLNERAAGREPDERSWAAIDTKRRWIEGQALAGELAAALDAACDAARDAAWAAARDADGTADWAAASAAAWAADRDAARPAAWAAAWAADRDAARAADRDAELAGVRAMLVWLEENHND